MKAKFSFVLFMIISLIFITACSTSIDSILTDYNGKFNIDYSDSITNEMLSPGDDGFNPAEMLKPEYFVGSDSSLNISAPPRGLSPTWKVSDPITDELIPIRTFGNSYTQHVVYEHVFSINARDCGLEEGKTYKLTLEVYDKGGLLYTDVCAVVIYKRYNFE